MRPLLRLALPVLAEQVLSMLVGFSEQLLTGWFLQQEHLAAINSMVYVLWFLASLFTVVTIAATAMTARFVGARQFDMARRVTGQAFLIGGVVAVVTMAVGLSQAEHVVELMQLTGPAAVLARRYLTFMLPVLPLMMCELVGNACLRGAGDTVTGLLAMIVTNVVNLLLSWSLVVGWGPFPTWGWDGLAIGAAGGYAVGGLVVLARLMRGRAGLALSWQVLRPDRDLIRRLLRIGVPGGTDILSIVLCQMWFVRIVNELGTLAAAAHGVAIRIESLAYLPGVAFQVAAATLCGQYLGAGDERRASRSVLTACLAGGGTMTAAAVFFFTAAHPLTRLFVPDQYDVQQLAVPLLRIVAIGIPPLAFTMIFNGALRGAGDTRWPLLFSLIGYLGVRIPFAYLLAHHWQLGVQGAWYAMVADLMLRCLMVSLRFFHGGWKGAKV